MQCCWLPQVVHRPADALLRSESRKVLQYRAGALRPVSNLADWSQADGLDQFDIRCSI